MEPDPQYSANLDLVTAALEILYDIAMRSEVSVYWVAYFSGAGEGEVQDLDFVTTMLGGRARLEFGAECVIF